MNRNDVVITGCGVVSPFGQGAETLVAALRRGESGVRSMGEQWNAGVDGTYCRLAAPVPDTVSPKSIPRKLRRSMGRDGVFAQLAAGEAVAHSGIGSEFLRSGRAGVAIGSTITSPGSLAAFFEDFLVARSVRQVPANGFFRVMGNSSAANVANCLGVTGRVHATPAACASGVVAIGVGFELIRSGAQEAMICGGVEELHPSSTAIFDAVGASSTHFNDRPERAPAPFDRDRDGTVCGEGAGVLVLESEESARSRGARVMARVLGFAATSDGGNMAHPGSAAMVGCMQGALESAQIDAGDVDYVNAHGTGTEQGDRVEARAIAEVFGNATPVSSLKGNLGHTLGASGAIEAVACISMMKDSYLLPTAKLRAVDPECACIAHVLALEEAPVRQVLKCSFGFGGANGALILGRGDDGSF